MTSASAEPSRSVRVLSSLGIAIRESAAYPGVRTDAAVEQGETHEFLSQCVVTHTLGDGRTRDTMFYELADGRGWVHDFSPDAPNQKQLAVLLDFCPTLKSQRLQQLRARTWRWTPPLCSKPSRSWSS